MNVNFVTRALRILVIWLDTEEHIREKNHILAKFVMKVLAIVQL